MSTSAGLTRCQARWALAQSSLAEMHGVLVYAEGFAIVAAGVTVSTGEPARLVRKLVDATLRGELQWMSRAHTFPIHLRKATRLEIAGQLLLHARTRGHTIGAWEARLGPVQVGGLRGVEQLAHWAGEMMPSVRANDDATLQEAIKLTDFVRTRLQAFAGEPDDEDTARIVAPAVAAVALDEPGGRKPN